MPHLADLLSEQSTLLARVLAGRSYQVIDDREQSCRIVAEDVTIRFDYLWREQWIISSIVPHSVPQHPLDLHADIDTDMWLKARGGDWPKRRSERMTARQLIEELHLVEQVLISTFADPVAIRDGLLFHAGYSEGYTDRVSVPEDAPPPGFVSRLLSKLRS